MRNVERVGKVQTVTGLIDPDLLGITLMHEHLLLDVGAYFDPPEQATARSWVDAALALNRLGSIGSYWHINRDNTSILDERFAAEQVRDFRLAGGSSLVDTTNVGLGRDPLALARISRATGLNIIMGSAYYVRLFHPDDMSARDEESITEEIITDVTCGVGNTGVRAGVIGEVGIMWPPNDNEDRVLRASAKAQVETGASITIHPGFNVKSPPRILDELVRTGADLNRVVIGHLDTFHDRGLLAELASAGCYLQWDTFGMEETLFGEVGSGSGHTLDVPSDEQRIDALEYVLGLGHPDKILISHDVFIKSMTSAYGAKGYDHIVINIVDRLLQRGWHNEQINALLVDNPGHILTLR